ncbi:c2h2 finger domain-containing protein [Rutstroemia sp. NJR-2017a WRK4]|nr:c2h2 finger domain-containing protein [Rutstroemia sp. NJR-2017a WRK4]
MEPSSKKRRLAPKVPEQSAQEQSPQARYDQKAMPNLAEPAPSNERSDFESFARHLQDAAMLIYAQANRAPYTGVTVLLLRWEEDSSVEQDLLLLQKVFQERFNFRTESWNIPSGPNPNIKLTMQLAQHIEHTRPDNLLIVYYAGYGFVGADHQLYWACLSNSSEDSPKFKWEGIKFLLEDAQPDVLLLLDSCATTDSSAAGSQGIKQGIAAYSPDQVAREPGTRSFTYHLSEALNKLGTGRPFSTQRLHEEIISQKHNGFLQHTGLTNGAGKAASAHERMPVSFSLTPGTLQSISLSPLSQVQRPSTSSGSPSGASENNAQGSNSNEEPIKSTANSDLTFEEVRALVCTTFVGEPSQDMASFKQWLHNTPLAASKIAVEGMFHGPPTILLVSMPIAVWNVLAAEGICLFLGYINSHNMTTDYQHLIGAISPVSKAATYKELEDGKILLEAREAAASTPLMTRHEGTQQEPIRQQEIVHQTPTRPSSARQENILSNSQPLPQVIFQDAGPPNAPEHTDAVEDSVEMHEAAEQLKALSHVRHVSQDHLTPNERNHSHLPSEESPGRRSGREESASSQDQPGSEAEDQLYNSEYNSPASARQKPRRSAQKQGPKQDTRCSMCSHAPFKDSSSLRKHIAAAHTRPFPCAFSFAGCTSTFGSKNEWKRHIASQHLCLTYYRCSSCPQSTVEGKGNEFNRKDLFTQHLRRMHAPFAIKKALAKGDSKLQVEWETHVKEMQASCLVTRRQPPQRSACPKSDCSNVFEGAGSWDDWTEHVGRHMEKGEANRLGVDRLLARWALDEGIIERKEDGEYRLCGAEREASNGNGNAGMGGGLGAGYYSDGGGGAKKDLEEEKNVVDPLMSLTTAGAGDGMIIDG